MDRAIAELWKALDGGALCALVIGGRPRRILRLDSELTTSISTLRSPNGRGFMFLRQSNPSARAGRAHSTTARPVKRVAPGAFSNRGRGVNRFSANPKRPIALVPYGVVRASAQVSSSSRAGHSSCPQSVRPYSTFGGT